MFFPEDITDIKIEDSPHLEPHDTRYLKIKNSTELAPWKKLELLRQEKQNTEFLYSYLEKFNVDIKKKYFKYDKNAFFVKILMHSSLDNQVVQDSSWIPPRWVPKWLYTRRRPRPKPSHDIQFISKEMFNPKLNIIKTVSSDIGCSSWDFADNFIFLQKLLKRYFLGKISFLDFKDLFNYTEKEGVPQTVRKMQREHISKKDIQTLNSQPYLQHSAKQDKHVYNTFSNTSETYNPLHIHNVQRVNKKSDTNLINKSYSLYPSDFQLMDTQYYFRHYGIQIINLYNGEIYDNIGTLEGLRELSDKFSFNATPIIKKIKSNLPLRNSILVDKFYTMDEDVFSTLLSEQNIQYNGTFSHFPEIKMENIIEILNEIGAEEVFMVDFSCSSLSNFNDILPVSKIIMDNKAVGKKKTKKHNYKRTNKRKQNKSNKKVDELL